MCVCVCLRGDDTVRKMNQRSGSEDVKRTNSHLGLTGTQECRVFPPGGRKSLTGLQWLIFLLLDRTTSEFCLTFSRRILHDGEIKLFWTLKQGVTHLMNEQSRKLMMWMTDESRCKKVKDLYYWKRKEKDFSISSTEYCHLQKHQRCHILTISSRAKAHKQKRVI